MRLSEIMTSPVAMVPANVPLSIVARHMRENDVGAMPVVENERVAGVITDRDIVVRGVAAGLNLEQATAGEVMSRDLVCNYEDEHVERALQSMIDRKVRRVVVIDRNRKATGILSLGDVASRVKGEPRTQSVLESIASGDEPVRSSSR